MHMVLVSAERPVVPRGLTPLSVNLLPSSDRSTAAAAWQELERSLDHPGVACGWTWTRTWLEHFGDLVPHWFAVAEQDGTTKGIALVTQGVRQRRGPVPVKTVHIGTSGEPIEDGICVEYNRLLVGARDRDAFARGIYAAVRSSGPPWEEFMLDGFVPDDAAPFLTEDDSFFVRREACPTSDLAAIRAAGGDVIASLGKNTRARVRRSMRDLGNVEIEWSTTPERAETILDELIVLHQRRWQEAGKPGAFAGGRFRAFHRALIPRLLAEDTAFVVRVGCDRGTVGCLYGFIEHGRALFYQSGFQEFDEGRISPGLVAHALCMQTCLDRGIDEYDFLMGEMRYKRELSNSERTLIWAAASRPGIKGKLLTLARRRKYGESQTELASQTIAQRTE